MVMDRAAATRQIVEAAQAMELEVEAGQREGETVVILPGEKKLRTVVSLLVGAREVTVSAFVVRNPDENHEEFYRHILRRNLRLSEVGLAYAIDTSGDVYVVGRIAPELLSEETLDVVFGAIIEAADSPFNELLVLGFFSTMQREWAWRISRGESLRNLEAFRHLLEGSESADRE